MGGDTLANAGKLDDTLDRFGATATGLGNRLAAKVMPQVTKFVASLSAGIQPGGRFEKMIDSLGGVGGKIGDFIGPAFTSIMDKLPEIFKFIGGIARALEPVMKPLLGVFDSLFNLFVKMEPFITGLINFVASVLGPVLETLGNVIDSISKIGDGQQRQAQQFAKGGSGPAQGRWPVAGGRIPMSPQTSTINSNSTTTSTVGINVNGPPGTTVNPSKGAPPVTLNTGANKSSRGKW